MNARVAQLQIAFMTLTRLPVGQVAEPVPDMASARWAYPLVGAVVGAIIGVAVVLAEWLGLPALVGAMVGIVVGMFVTGAIHEDGLADCADGFWGARDRSDKLEIMRDSRIGTYGTIALIASFGLRSASLAALTTLFLPIMAVSALSRFAMVVALERLPSARESGLGASASGGAQQVWIAGILCAATMFVLLVAVGPLASFVAFLALCVVGICAAYLALRHVGGQTGDVLGAIQQVCEVAGLVALSAMSV